MAEEVTIGGNGALFVGEDKTLKLEVLDDDDVPVEITDWAVQLVVSRHGSTLITSAATITGSYDAVRADNTQRAVVTLTDTDMTIAPGTHTHSWKRTDDGSETILAYGLFIVEKATQT